ncbi:glycosyltransferase family 39 protein [Dyadobacter aurulentus]|uniref:glycosyltransferase family 39 protein n=1 Tax=Dyadobacter sp. UC 10 TaxID=2605428 RepID=UPI0011F1063D|nr:glycosyltransferase family 39 protein [Dyadobacter sp. UC 10]KAA0989358.1 glycosyltransferase family 39 protein [Dyadobacter sp. UC 10]
MSKNSTSGNLRPWLIFSIILIAGLALRFYRLDRFSIFFDEKSTMVVSQGIVLEGANQKEVYSTQRLAVKEFWKAPKLDYKPPVGVIRSFTYDEIPTLRAFTPAEFWAPKSIQDYYDAITRSDIGNSPFYYVILHLWMDIFGLSDFSARALSVIFSTLIIALTFFFARRFFSVNTGLIAAGIVAIEPFFVAYSHQARNYSLTFLLTLLATYFFLQIIENKYDTRKTLWLYAGYILSAGLGLLSHFLTISVLLAHAAYALFFLRSIKGWIRMAIAAVLSLSGLAWWLTFGGGYYTLYTLNDQALLYKRMAETNPFNNPYGLILPATPANVFERALPIFTDLVIFTNGLTDALSGKRNVLLALAIGILLIFWFRFKHKINTPGWLIHRFPFLLIIAAGFFYNHHKLQFTIFSISIFALSFIPDIHKQASPEKRKRLWMLYLMGLIPTFFLIFMAFRAGHTYGLNQRYPGFSFPYVIILLSLLLQYFRKLDIEFKVLIYGFLLIQLGFVGLRLREFYQDRSTKYGYFANPREPNPYYAAAQKIKSTYQPGDTIYYPAVRLVAMREMDKTFLPVSVQDAQLTNIYLPKNAQYVQVLDTLQADRIWIKRSGQVQPVEIGNLKGVRY